MAPRPVLRQSGQVARQASNPAMLKLQSAMVWRSLLAIAFDIRHEPAVVRVPGQDGKEFRFRDVAVIEWGRRFGGGGVQRTAREEGDNR